MTKRHLSESSPVARKRQASIAPSEVSFQSHSDTSTHDASSQSATGTESHSDISSQRGLEEEELTVNRIIQRSSHASPTPLTPVSTGGGPDESRNEPQAQPSSRHAHSGATPAHAEANLLSIAGPSPWTRQSAMPDARVSPKSVSNDAAIPSQPQQQLTLASAPSRELVPYNSPVAFPLFRSGNVVISSKSSSTSTGATAFQLHSAILAHHSPWFAKSFQEQDEDALSPAWYAYTLEELGGRATLSRQTAIGDRPIIHDLRREATAEVQIKLEEGKNSIPSLFQRSSSVPDSSSVTRRTLGSPSAMDFYYQVLGAFYSVHPTIDKTHIEIALREAEGLTNIAAELGCLHLLRPFLRDALGQHRQKLFLAIKRNPPRWLKLSIALEDDSIYTESLVHLVGAHPRWPWRPKSVLPPEIQHLIAQKAAELDRMCVDVDRDLLMVTIVGQDRKPVPCEDRSQRETWMIVQLFRDAIANGLRALERKKRGTCYRKILAGGSAYLDYPEIRDSCRKIMLTEWDDLAEDLKSLKAYASHIVEKVGANELMIDPDTNGIGYLTCVKVSAEDIPWRSKETSISGGN